MNYKDALSRSDETPNLKINDGIWIRCTKEVDNHENNWTVANEISVLRYPY